MIYILAGLNIVAQLAIVGLLVFLCFRTRSKGLILISAILLTSGFFDSIFTVFFNPYTDWWIGREVSNWLTQSINVGGFPLRMVDLIKPLLYKSLCLLGVFLIYKEWRLGKFRFSQSKHREELTV